MIVEIQCLPSPSGDANHRYTHVHAAIAVIEASGLAYEVGPLGTSIEGDPDQLWPLVRAVHEATMASGAEGCYSVVKAFEDRGTTARSMGQLTDRYRS